MEPPKFLICPECDEKYNTTKKRRIIDSCGHPRCFSCLVSDSQCPMCKKLLRNRRRSVYGSKDSLLSGEEDCHGRDAKEGISDEHDTSSETSDERRGSWDISNLRRGSLDSYMTRLHKKTHFGSHGNTLPVSPLVSSESLHSNSFDESRSHNASPKRNSFPFTYQNLRKVFLSKDDVGTETYSTKQSSSPALKKCTRQSSDYWSESEL